MSEFCLMVTLRAEKGQETGLRRELEALVEPSRREAGNLRFDLYADKDDPGRFIVLEHWASEEDQHRHHTQAPHVRDFNAKTAHHVERIEAVQTLVRLVR